MKYEKGWTFDTFLYKNYGFSTTRFDKLVAFSYYCRKIGISYTK